MNGDKKIRPVAIYLPQFHPTPENDEWWGKGFTEWTNVVKAKPFFKGHYQPQFPADLGFYDLRVPEVREQQAQLAKHYGIYGFCYYHYWFHGKRLLYKPLDDVLAGKKPDFPFMLFWANESWSRRWWGEEKEILIKQTYSKEDDINHINWLCEHAFSDERYIKIYDRPAFVIYRPKDFPNQEETVRLFKETAIKKGLPEPYLIASNSHTSGDRGILKLGFDAILNFRPQLSALPGAFNDNFSYNRLRKNILNYNVYSSRLKIYEYADALEFMKQIEPKTYDNIIPSVFVGWDNTARRGDKAIIIKNSEPGLFKHEFQRVSQKVKLSASNPGFVFINAWNEWAEGNHLEPDNKNGLQFLEILKIAIDETN